MWGKDQEGAQTCTLCITPSPPTLQTRPAAGSTSIYLPWDPPRTNESPLIWHMCIALQTQPDQHINEYQSFHSCRLTPFKLQMDQPIAIDQAVPVNYPSEFHPHDSPITITITITYPSTQLPCCAKCVQRKPCVINKINTYIPTLLHCRRRT